MHRLVVATHNLKKGGEMVTILHQLLPDLKVHTLADFPGAPEPEETGETYFDNAAIKSESAARFTGLPSLADDAGLEIDALDGSPGLHSKRFGGEELSFDKKMERILDLLALTPKEKRTARFRCSIALSIPGSSTVFERSWATMSMAREGQTVLFQSTCEGLIANERKGEGGFGYDPIFFLPELNRHMAELTSDEKHAISHRGKVLRQFAEYVRSYFLTNAG